MATGRKDIGSIIWPQYSFCLLKTTNANSGNATYAAGVNAVGYLVFGLNM